MVSKLGILLNYIILYSVCILISVNYGAKEHIVISGREDKINSIMKSTWYELNNERQKLSNQEDFDKYGMYYVLSIYETTEENKDFNLNYISVSR